MPEPPRPSQGVHSAAVPTIGQNGSSITSSPVGTSSVPPVTTFQDKVIQKVRVIRRTGDPGSRSYSGSAMVEGSPSYKEWERHHPTASRSGDRD